LQKDLKFSNAWKKKKREFYPQITPINAEGRETGENRITSSTLQRKGAKGAEFRKVCSTIFYDFVFSASLCGLSVFALDV